MAENQIMVKSSKIKDFWDTEIFDFRLFTEGVLI